MRLAFRTGSAIVFAAADDSKVSLLLTRGKTVRLAFRTGSAIVFAAADDSKVSLLLAVAPSFVVLCDVICGISRMS